MYVHSTFVRALLALCIFIGTGSVRAELVAHWKLDEAADAVGPASIEDSGPSALHHGTPVFVVDPVVTFGYPGATEDTGTAAGLRGGSIDVPFDPELNPESFTFSVWAKANAVGNFQSVVTSRNDIGPGQQTQGYILYLDTGGNWSFWTGQGAPGWPAVVGPPALIGEWQHLAISFDAATGTKTLWVDGVPTSATDQMYTPNDLRDLHLGGGGDFGTQYRLDGFLDDAALWDVALVEEEILDVLVDGPEVVPDGLVAYWMLDEPDGTVGPGSVVDDSGGDHHGDVPGAPFVPEQPGANANTGTAIGFSDASIDVFYDPALNPESFTVTAWARPASSVGFQSVITSRNDIGPGQQTQGYILYLDNGGNWSFWTGHGAPGWPAVVGPPVRVGEWQHLAISFDALTGTKTLYVDGVEVASALDQGYVPNVLRDVHIGAGGDLGAQFRFVGEIDDVGLWNEALTEEEIQEVLAQGIGGGDGPTQFKRGDSDASGDLNITDGIFLLNYLFLGGSEPPCVDGADPDDSGDLNITDGIYILNFLFLGGDAPAEPFETCGTDPTDDALACDSYPPCS